MFICAVCDVEIVGQFGIFRSHGIDAAHFREHVERFAAVADAENILLHVAGRILYQTCYLEVGETEPFCFCKGLAVEFVDIFEFSQPGCVFHNVVEAFDEPTVNLGQFYDAVYRVAILKCFGDGEDAQVGRVGERVIKIVELDIIVANEAVHSLSDHAEAFLYDLFERFADRHDLANGLHRGTDLAVNTGEFREVPARNLDYHVVNARSNVC